VPKNESKKSRLLQFLERTRPAVITAAEWGVIAAELAPISETYLRDLLRNCGLALDPLIEGVRQDTLDNLERTLLQLETQYDAGDREIRRACRALVIRAKDHARFALAKKPEKQEMILWMITWLENPSAFPLWIELRKRELHS